MTRAPSIERQIKLVAIVGGLLFLSLAGALFFVERSLGATQTDLADNVVPSQRSLGDLSGTVGEMFLRQSEVVAASSEGLRQLADRSSLEARARAQVNEIRDLLRGAGMRDQADFPVDDAARVVRDVDEFLASDARLYLDAVALRDLEARFADRMDETGATLRRLSERAGGIAGVVRLAYVDSLRQLDAGLQTGNVPAALVRQIVLGDTRAQLRALNQLASSVHGMGTLVGKVGLAATQDVVNSLAANDLTQSLSQIHDAISQVESLVAASAKPATADRGVGSNGSRYALTHDEITQRVHALAGIADELLRGAGDGAWDDSLISLRRRVLAQDQRVVETQGLAARTASRLDAALSTLRAFAQAVAQRARASASATISSTRLITSGLLISGLIACLVVGIRIRSSVTALRAQNHRLEDLSAELGRTNAELEERVAARTASLQLVLDSTGDGLISVGLDGSLLPERSRAVTDWFGPPPDAAKIWSYLSPDPGYRDMFRVGFEQLVDDVLPFEIAAVQLPRRTVRDGRTFELQLREVRDHGKLARVLVTVQDISARLDADRIEADAREFHHLVGFLLKDIHGFRHSVDECSALVTEIANATDAVVARRALHTLKGNCGVVGFERMADYLHELESELANDDRVPARLECDALAMLWARSLDNIGEYLPRDDQRQVDVKHQDLIEITELARRGAGRNTLLTILETWQAEPTSATLDRLATHARNVAARLAKELRVTIEHNRLRAPGERLRAFWAVLVHVIRNAVDHGLESPEERRAAGKPRAGLLALSTRSVNGELIVEVRDDGRGIDWAAVGRKASALGQPHATRADLVEALFADGLSTKDEVTSLSGRGVGLGAVRATCRAAGGEVVVDSEPGQGTRLQFRFAARVLRDEPRLESQRLQVARYDA
jgi:HPt (histidine-containing phosphotransfer) domain-containing protein